jgi:hypothetical protein
VLLVVGAWRWSASARSSRRGTATVSDRLSADRLYVLDTRFDADLHWNRLNRQFTSRTCMPRFVTSSRPPAQHPLTEFYREEFKKHQQCLQRQRPYYSESAITDVEAALTRIMGQLEQLCSKDNADQVVGSLLKKFDVVTGLSAWSDPKQTH